MRELPALFSTPMVEAIQENRKTMTRRTKGLEKVNENPEQWVQARKNDMTFSHPKSGEMIIVKPKYNKGDHIWVRERFETDTDGTVKFYAGNIEVKHNKPYRQLTKWKPGIHMFKKDARLWLECTGVRCERLQDITEADAIAEGILSKVDETYKYPVYQIYYKIENNWWSSNPIDSFSSLWEMINGEDSWLVNPWVFIYEFKRIEKP